MPERKKRAYCYTRVSTGMQVDGYSLDAQRERIEKYAYGADIELIEPFFSDEGRSGKSIEDETSSSGCLSRSTPEQTLIMSLFSSFPDLGEMPLIFCQRFSGCKTTV